jgi:hypothetical protein
LIANSNSAWLTSIGNLGNTQCKLAGGDSKLGLFKKLIEFAKRFVIYHSMGKISANTNIKMIDLIKDNFQTALVGTIFPVQH